MENGKTPVVNKLILLVLVGICICLVVLIAQNRSRTQAERSPAAATAVAEDTTDAGRWDSEPPVRLRVTNNVPRSRPAPIASAQPRQTPSDTVVQQDQPVKEVASTAIESIRSETSFMSSSGSAGGAWISVMKGSAEYPAGRPILGRVFLLGKPPPEISIPMDPVCAKLYGKPPMTRHYVVGEKGGLANVWVYIENAGTGPFLTPTQQLVLNQLGCVYEPYVFGVMVGQPVLIRNSDPMPHNINTTASVSPANRFNIAQPFQGKEDTKVFSMPEVPVKFMCNIHPWMFAYGGVFDHPFFAVSDSEGRFEIPPGLPPGRYTLVARHLRAGLTRQEIVLREGAADTPLGIVVKVGSR